MKLARLFTRSFPSAAAILAILGAGTLHAQFQGIGGLFAGDVYSQAYALSGDGSTVVGSSIDGNGNLGSFRWTAAGGMVALPVINPEWSDYGGGYSEAYAVSHNGSVIVGQDYNLGSEDGGTRQAYRWTAGAAPSDTGTITGLPYADPDYSYAGARGVSADGSVVVGMEGGYLRAFRWTAAGGMEIIAGEGSEAAGVSANGAVVAGTAEGQAFRWTESGGLHFFLAGAGLDSSQANAISADGSTLVGNFNEDHAFAWTESGGLQFLDELPGSSQNHVLAVSGDGRWAVGHSGESYAEIATLWDTATGEVRDLNELFTTAFGFDLEGWTLQVATGISGDGLTITGWGLNPDGAYEGWIAHMTVIPEPAAYAALAGALTLPLALWRRRHNRIP
jgi:uncharacterized membrane protein